MFLSLSYQLDHCLFKLRDGSKTSYGRIEIVPSTTGFSTSFRKKNEASLDYKDFSVLREMNSQIFRATVVYNFITLTKSLIPCHVDKSLPVRFLKYFVNASSTPGSSFDQEHLGEHILP